MKIRIGQGIDFHRLDNDLNLWIGGIKIPSEKGCVAHSDGDVLLHAICDALLGAAGLRDIGYYFPDSSNEFKNIDSKILLGRTCTLICEKGFSVINIDSTVCLEKPKISSFIPDMKSVISEITGTEIDDVSIKATTTEKLGFTGREEGIMAIAVVLLSGNNTITANRMVMDKTTLVLGASANTERFSYDAIRSLQKNNIPVIAIGRRDADLGDIKISRRIPPGISGVHTVTLYMSAANQKEFYSLIMSLNPKRIIFNPGTTNPELAGMAMRKGITVVNECMLVMLKQGVF